MSSSSGTAWSAPITRLRAALAADPRAVRLLVTAAAVVALWLLGWRLIATAPSPTDGILVYRVDVNEIAAYPRSDAAMDYLNAMAILSGDGWVNWRDTNRWSVYRPGWGAFLAVLGLVTGADPAAMQGILNFLLGATVPAFMLLVAYLYPGRRDLLLALLATVAWALEPFFGWWLQRTMMSEGPTMLLSLLFCLLALRFGRRHGEWSWRQGLALGLVGGALSLVRGQSRFGVLLVVLLLAALALGAMRRRLPFFVSLACGMLLIVGPVLLKTSLHLRMAYTGTSFTALYNMLEYSRVGRYLGGSGFSDGVTVPEREAMKRLQGLARRGLAATLTRPGEMLREGYHHFSRSIYASVATLFGLDLPPPEQQRPVAGKLFVLYSLAGLGLFFGWRRAGPVALVPLLFAVGYFSPMVAFYFYSNRLGMPVSWVGSAYVAGALLLVLGPGRRAPSPQALETEPADPRAPSWPGRPFYGFVAGWLVAATAALLWLDLRSPPAVDAGRLFADQRSRRALAGTGLAADAALEEETDRLLDGGGVSERLLVGVAVLPTSIAPGDEPVLQPFSLERLAPGEEGLDLFYLVSPWKRGGTLGMFRVRLPHGGASTIRHGDEVLVLRADSAQSVGRNRVVRLNAVAALPTRWAE